MVKTNTRTHPPSVWKTRKRTVKREYRMIDTDTNHGRIFLPPFILDNSIEQNVT